MSNPEPETNPGPQTAADGSRTADGRGRIRTWSAALGAGMLAAVLTGTAGEVTVNWFDAGGNMALGPQQGGGPTLGGLRRAAVRNASLTYGIQGGVLGLLLGLAGGVATRSARGAMVGGLAGLVLGGAAGVGLSAGVFNTFLRVVDPNSDDLIPPLLAHAAVWGVIGAAGGLAFGVGSGHRIGRALLGGLLGAALGVGLYEFAGVLLFPTDQTTLPIAEARPPRLLAHVLIDLLTAIGVALAVQGSSPRPAAQVRDPS